MPDNVENLILEHLPAGQDRIEDEIKERLERIEKRLELVE